MLSVQEQSKLESKPWPTVETTTFGQYRWLDSDHIEIRYENQPVRRVNVVIDGDELKFLLENRRVEIYERQ